MSNAKMPRSWITTVIVAGAALTFGLLVLLPIQRSIAELRSKLREQKDFVREATTTRAQIVELQQRKQAANEIVNQWQAHAPSDDAMATFIGTVSELARQAGAEPGRITPRKQEALDSLVKHPAEMAVEGGFHEITAFISELERRQETIWITDLTLQPTSHESKLRSEIRFTVFSDRSDNSG